MISLIVYMSWAILLVATALFTLTGVNSTLCSENHKSLISWNHELWSDWCLILSLITRTVAFCLCNLVLISPSCFLVKVNCLIWSPPGRRGPSPRAKPLCHTSYGKFLRGRAAPRPPHDRRRASQTASPLLLGGATLWAWLQAGVVLTPPVSWLMKWERFKILTFRKKPCNIVRGIFFSSGVVNVSSCDAFDTHTPNCRCVTVVKITAQQRLKHTLLNWQPEVYRLFRWPHQNICDLFFF